MTNQTRTEKIKNILQEHNEPSYRYDQIIKAIYEQGVERYDQITSISKDLRNDLIKALGENILSLDAIHEIKGSQVYKVLLKTKDNHKIESVLMTYRSNDNRDESYNSICLSSQSGCALKCTFCSTGSIGFKKNLSADEIVDQLLFFKQKKLPVKSISFMGMGEPFANPNLFDSLKIITDKKMLGYSQRKINVSTVGIIPGIERLTKEYPHINLAFSLHSAFPDQRLYLMPITKAYPIDDVMIAIDKHIKATNRKVFLAYVLLDKINDSPEHAKELIKLIKRQNNPIHFYHVNLIRFNSGVELGKYKKPKKEKIDSFIKILKDAGISHTLRVSFGNDIEAACGQLYGEYEVKLQKENNSIIVNRNL